MSGPNQKILLVDDDEDLILAVSKILEAKGYAVISAPNSTIGMEKAKQELPDLLIIDVMMEKFAEGFTFIQSLMDEPVTKDIPRILLTALGLQERLDAVSPQELGTVRILRKPVMADALLDAVKSAIVVKR